VRILSDPFYVLNTSDNVLEYLNVGDSLNEIRKPCAMSEFQYLNHKVMTAELEENSGHVCQDFIYDHGIPLISEKVKDFLDEWGVDYLFYKKIILKKSDIGLEEIYWLALPPRINCLDMEQSEIDDFLNAADRIIIDPERIGRFDIFKLAGVTNLEIIITSQLANQMREQGFIGMHIDQLD